MRKKITIIIFFIPFVAYTQSIEKVSVYVLESRKITHYGKERKKPFWKDVTHDVKTSISADKGRCGMFLKVSHDSIVMNIFIRKDIYFKSDSVNVLLRPNVSDAGNVLIMAQLLNSMISGTIIKSANVPYHEVIFYFSSQKKYEKIQKKMSSH